ncbi:MAG: 1,4-alpha-glucan branching protein GlgB [Clostridia bacterium]|nr:1,4-alpha-glucan branching protein GlgB [Clostridia bacterium]
MRYVPPDSATRDSFHAGTCADAYRFLGAHRLYMDGEDYYSFAVWAPNARAVSVVGEFNGWSVAWSPMEKQYDGIWEKRLPARLFTPESDPDRFSYENAAELLLNYKYAIQGPDGQWHEKADPFAFRSERTPNTASRLCDLDGFTWHDQAWMAERARKNWYRSPVNIYELHLGSWRRHEDGRYLSYEELGDELIPYLLDMGYTHVEFLPVMEHPFDGSWGYQVTGFYAPTAWFGAPWDFARLIDRLHQAGIGVFLDWVPAHFPRDEAGLRRFDGTPLFEHPDPRRGDMPQWGTHFFDYGRGEVRSFMLSNACFWLEYYHADGLRCDAVSSMLYLDFCREPGQWLPNEDGSNLNHEAIRFLKELNTAVYARYPGAQTIAEESSAYPMVTWPISDGGLGFGFKWNMGWMNDMLSYVEMDPLYRRYHHEKLTFSLMYAFSENYVLPFSHDEVVHGKRSMLDKQPGDLWRKFAGLRALYGYQTAHPGKKLLFMGGEFGQFIEWKDNAPLDWFLLSYERHPNLQTCVREMNRFYRSTPAFYEIDDSWDGFEWLNADDRDRSVVAFERRDQAGNAVVCVTNFTPANYEDYRLPLTADGILTEALNTDDERYAGSGVRNVSPIRTEREPCAGKPFSAVLRLPPLATVYFTFDKLVAKEDGQAEHD